MDTDCPQQSRQIVALKKRADFVRLRNGGNWTTPTFVLAGAPSEPARSTVDVHDATRVSDEDAIVRIGYTVTKKHGSAVIRNRIRRRLRHAVKQIAPGHARAGFDYVLIARKGALKRPFAALTNDLRMAFTRLNDPGSGPRTHRGANGRRRANRNQKAEGTQSRS